MQRNTINHRAQFMPAFDSRNRRVRGLCIRNDRFYAQLWIDLGNGRKSARRLPLLDEDKGPIRSLAQAKDALVSLLESRKRNTLPARGRKPRFDVFAAQYLEMASTRQKRRRTLEKEAAALAMWRSHLGGVRLDQITTPLIRDFIEKRLNGCHLCGKHYDPAAPRTVALDLIALRNVLNVAADLDHLRELPRFPRVKVPPPPRRALLTPEDLENLLTSCFRKKPNGDPITKNGQQLYDFLRLLAFSGAREQEALHLRWRHVDFAQRRLFIGLDENFVVKPGTIGTGGEAKNRRSRVVDFNLQLESHLQKMYERRAPDSDWMFPSPQRGERDIRAKTFRESLRAVRTAAGLPTTGFHDLRHFFVSCCVMSGIDFMTVSTWVGHRDGGILIGKVYGHLVDKHRQQAAKAINFQLST